MSEALLDAPDPAVARAEERLRALEELREIGMKLARRLGEGESDGPARGRDPADAFARLSRAIRLTIALETETDRALADLKAGVVRGPRETPKTSRRRAEAHRELDSRQDRIHRLMADAIEGETDDWEACQTLFESLNERLYEDEAYADLSDRPLREVVEQLCKDIGLTPDWSQWRDEGWGLNYARRTIPPEAGGTPAVQAAPGPEPGRPPPPPAAGPSLESHPDTDWRAKVAELSRRLD